MEKITKVTEADVGRVAVDEDSLYRVKILGLTQEESRVRVEYLPGSEYGNGRMVGKISESFNLAINGGGNPMYWEESTLSNLTDVYPKEKKENVAKPRFRKPRQKPPIRQKTDATIIYSTGERYTIKFVTKLEVNDNIVYLEVKNDIDNDVKSVNITSIKRASIEEIQIKSPSDFTRITFSYIGMVINSQNTHCVGASFWQRTF